MHQLCLVLKILASLLLFLSTNAFTSPIISRSVYHSAPSTKKFYTLSRLLSEKSPANSPAIDGSGDKTKKKLRIAVIGGGWAGYSLCESISTNNLPTKRGSRGDIEIIMVDASKQAKGGLAGGYRDETKNNRPVEAGIHGFWREYRNTFNIMESIEGVDVDEVLGSFSPSVLYSKNGKVAVAPVLLDEDQQGSDSGFCVNKYGKMPVIKDVSEKSIRRYIAALLPPPLDLPLLAEIDNDTNGKKGDSKLSPIDLLSGLGLVGAWADFEQESRVSWERYDSQPASLLFEKAGITDALYEEMVSPLLHVLPMCPAYDCSAAAALSCFHVFALQSKGAFDVRWCRGSISEKIFDLWQRQLEQRGVSIRGGSRVASIEKNYDGKFNIRLDSMDEKTENSHIVNCDAVVLAVGAVAAGKLAASSPALNSLDAARDFDKLRGITCVAVRLFLKPHPTVTTGLKGGLHEKTQLQPDFANAMIDSPIAVCGAGIGDIEELKETGFCIYDLQRMHDEFSVDYYEDHVDKEDQVAVLEIDFYRADSFVNCRNDEIVALALEAVSSALGTASKIDQSTIVDSTVLRARNAVSHFAPNSALYSPGVKLHKGLYCCGDWVDRVGHASWSTEKSVVTARQAANALSADFGLTNSQCNVIPAVEDTPQLTALRNSAKFLRTISPVETLPPSPWVFAKQKLSRDC